MPTGLVWERVNWRVGEDHYRFEIERGGLFGTINAPGNRSFTVPLVVWEALVDALKAQRATRTKIEQQFPVRTGARWYDGEAAELAQGFRAGRSIAALAKAHNRTEYAVENQLDKMGLFSKAEKYGPGSPNAAGRPGSRTATAAEEMELELANDRMRYEGAPSSESCEASAHRTESGAAFSAKSP